MSMIVILLSYSYVLRRILRRGVRYCTEKLNAQPGVFADLVPTVVDILVSREGGRGGGRGRNQDELWGGGDRVGGRFEKEIKEEGRVRRRLTRGGGEGNGLALIHDRSSDAIACILGWDYYSTTRQECEMYICKYHCTLFTCRERHFQKLPSNLIWWDCNCYPVWFIVCTTNIYSCAHSVRCTNLRYLILVLSIDTRCHVALRFW